MLDCLSSCWLRKEHCLKYLPTVAKTRRLARWAQGFKKTMSLRNYFKEAIYCLGAYEGVNMIFVFAGQISALNVYITYNHQWREAESKTWSLEIRSNFNSRRITGQLFFDKTMVMCPHISRVMLTCLYLGLIRRNQVVYLKKQMQGR